MYTKISIARLPELIIVDGKEYYRLKLTRSKYTIFDKADWKLLKDYTWCASLSDKPKAFYATARIKNTVVKTRLLQMHRLLLGLDFGSMREVDHKNSDKLDNRRCNLRIVTSQQNKMNRTKGIGCSSTYKGVSFRKKEQRWEAYIKLNGKKIYLGLFNSQESAALAYDNSAIELFKEYAKINFNKRNTNG